jgi:transcriptional regulator with XRE-family HTH domain
MTIKSKMTQKSLRDIEKITGVTLTLGKLLWAIRQSEDKSQLDFADKLSISKQHLCDIEHDRKSVSPKLAATYAAILGYSKEQFIRLSLQGMMDREGLRYIIEVIPKHSKKTHQHSNHNLSLHAA